MLVYDIIIDTNTQKECKANVNCTLCKQEDRESCPI